MHEAIVEARKVATNASRHLQNLESHCPHSVLEIHKWREETGIVRCSICNKDFGWWCPESLDHYCHYDDEHGEYCIYCGVPDERK
jgi:hypothetical protein